MAAASYVPQTRLPGRRDLSLMSRVLLANVAVLVVASVVLLVTPVTVSSPVVLREVVILCVGLVAVIAINALILRRAFEPLERLTEAMSRVEPVGDAVPVPVYGRDREVVELTSAFNEMLGRLRRERRESVRRSLRAQEGERHRVAQELHDEVGQSLTAMLLQIERVTRTPVDELPARLEELRDNVRESLDDVRRIAQRLRPELLDDLGLPSALEALAERVAEQTGLAIETDVDAALPRLDEETELVIYRVAQEALTNTLRHAGATHAALQVAVDGRALVLEVADNGSGLDGAAPGAGIAGMRERALLIGANLRVLSRRGGGTSVRLTIPERDSA